MKILIQHNGTHKYLRAANVWGKNPEDAHTFGSSFDAVLYCLERKLEGVNIIIERPHGRAPLVVLVDKAVLEDAGTALNVKPAKRTRMLSAVRNTSHRARYENQTVHV